MLSGLQWKNYPYAGLRMIWNKEVNRWGVFMIATLREFVDSFYASVEDNGCVTLEDFTEFMDFLAVIRDADSDAVQNIIAEVFMKSAEIRNRLSKQ